MAPVYALIVLAMSSQSRLLILHYACSAAM